MTALTQPTSHPPVAIEAAEWFTTLTATEQSIIRRETDGLGNAMIRFGMGKIAIGEHLSRIREILEPKSLWVKYLRTLNAFSIATAFRYIQTYESAKGMLDAPVLRIVMQKGLNVIDGDVLAKLPAPMTSDPAALDEYVNKLELVRRDSRVRTTFLISQDPDTIIRECVDMVNTRLNRLPDAVKNKGEYIRKFVGALVTSQGISNPITFEPLALPASQKRSRGRPRKEVAVD